MALFPQIDSNRSLANHGIAEAFQHPNGGQKMNPRAKTRGF
jgi:hypothetical protein